MPSTATVAARSGPFVKVNLGGISASLFESEMFGHVKGAFTDARADRKGRFEVAHGGTIFLDEIGDLDAGVAGEDAARAAGPHVRGARVEPAPHGGRAGRFRDQPEPGRDGHARRVSRRPALSHQPDLPCTCRPCASAATTSRCSRAGSSRRVGQLYRREGVRLSAGRDRLAAGAALARQHPAAAAVGRAHAARHGAQRPRGATIFGPPPTWNLATPRVIRCRPSAA